MQDAAGTRLSIEPTPSPQAADGQRSRQFRGWVVVLGTVTLLADQATKAWALTALAPGEPRPLLGEWIQLNLIRNSGAAFSIGNGATWLMTVIALAITLVVARAARDVRNMRWALALGLLLGGSLGNLVDRFFRQPGFLHGHVVDFIDYFGWFVGNVADIAIVGAAPLVAGLLWRGWSPSTPPAGPARHRSADDAEDADASEGSPR